MQNIVLLMEPEQLPDHDSDQPLKPGNMLLNRFCIDEEAAFESTGVYYLKTLTNSILKGSLDRKAKGKRD